MKIEAAAFRDTEQSANTFPAREQQQQCSHFPLVTHYTTKDAFVDNVKS